MKQEVYGIPVPRGVPKDWRAQLVRRDIAGTLLRKFTAPTEWGDPFRCVAWMDRFERTRLIVGHFDNERSATVRIDMNGNWKTKFGEVAG